jgi:choline dehydrogenase-like flavoprotein
MSAAMSAATAIHRREEYDYIIVGAGSAGCTLACRLGEDPSLRILVIEAGGWDRSPWIQIPLGWGKLLTERLADWQYFAEPEPNVDGRAVECARGKVVGGSSSTNAMAYVRGHPADYARWAAGGLPEWDFAHVLPYFRRMERWEDGADAWRGGDGPLTVQRCRYQDPLNDAFRQAAVALGYPWREDYNGAAQSGFGVLQGTIDGGRRMSAARAYLRPALARGNVTLTVQSHATRILFKQASGAGSDQAEGVEYLRHGVVHRAYARREVLLSGGVINSPQLLMLSGIGDPQALRAHNIALRHALPGVGRNLQDHVSTIVMYRRRDTSPFFRNMRADRIVRSLMQAYLFGSGFASDIPGGIMAFLHSQREDANNPDICPDMQMILTNAPLPAWPYFPMLRQPFTDGFSCRTVLLHPKSRGHLALRSDDALAAPRIHQNFLGHPDDWAISRAALRRTRELAQQAALVPHVAGEVLPGPQAQSDAELDAFIRRSAITVHHPAGTCRMGPANDAMAVTDSVGRVHGLQHLRVIDASLMPDLPSGNINAPTIMMAEKIADHLRGRAALAAD